MSVTAYCNNNIITQYYMHSFCKITHPINFRTLTILATTIHYIHKLQLYLLYSDSIMIHSSHNIMHHIHINNEICVLYDCTRHKLQYDIIVKACLRKILKYIIINQRVRCAYRNSST